MKKTLWIAILIALVLFLAYQLMKDTFKEPDIEPASVVQVTPTTDEKILKTIPKLPNKEVPKVAIPIKVKEAEPGVKVTPMVVISDVGNTYVAYVEEIDWGFRIDPKISVALIDRVIAGIDFSFFHYWRINLDALVYMPLTFDTAYVGVGVSGQVTNNFSVGVGYFFIAEPKACAFVSFDF